MTVFVVIHRSKGTYVVLGVCSTQARAEHVRQVFIAAAVDPIDELRTSERKISTWIERHEVDEVTST